MKVGFIVDTISRNAGGVVQVAHALAKSLTGDVEIEISVHGISDTQTEANRPAWDPIPLALHPPFGPRILGFSLCLNQALLKADLDLLHSHAIWQGRSFAVHRRFQAKRTPYLISPHGMLDPWALQRSRWKKQIASTFYESAHLRDATCLHALCQSELEAIRAYGLKQPICIIPNGVELVNAEMLKAENVKGERKILLFLGRLHPKKGLVNALRAWAEVTGNAENLKSQKAENWQFVIAGWDQGGHEEELKTLCRESGLSYAETPASELLTNNPYSKTKNKEPGTKYGERVAFAGPVFGDTKDALLRCADAFILPSFSEGLPMAVLEAWAYGLPVLMTDHCNLPEGFREGAALRIGTEAASIAEGMREMLQGSCQDLETMGSKGRALVEERFTWPKVATQMKEVYEWMLGGGEKPGCVV